MDEARKREGAVTVAGCESGNNSGKQHAAGFLDSMADGGLHNNILKLLSSSSSIYSFIYTKWKNSVKGRMTPCEKQ